MMLRFTQAELWLWRCICPSSSRKHGTNTQMGNQRWRQYTICWRNRSTQLEGERAKNRALGNTKAKVQKKENPEEKTIGWDERKQGWYGVTEAKEFSGRQRQTVVSNVRSKMTNWVSPRDGTGRMLRPRMIQVEYWEQNPELKREKGMK